MTEYERCLVKGKDLKKVITCTYGALIVRKGHIIFFDPTLNKITETEGCKPANNGFLFVSYNFSRLRKLEDNMIYELVYKTGAELEVKNYYTGETIDLIPGILVDLP